MTYQEAIDYLYSFINYDVQRQQRYAVNRMTLDRPRALAALLGNPHQHYPIVHLTGTKGKGSVGAMCAAILQAAGLKVGLYSSPHLQDFRERFKVNEELIPEEAIIQLVEQIKPAVAQVDGLMWFEIITVLAFEHFRQVGVDAAVIEVGLGGRLDATNIVIPHVSVITSLSFDHTSILGTTLAEIAGEKAGIIKSGVPVVSAPQPPEALAVLESAATQQGAPLTLIGRDWAFEPLGGDLWLENLLAAPRGEPLQPYQTVLLGRHQAINAAVALATIDQLREQGMAIPSEAARRGLLEVNWAGRLEIVRKDPMVVLDAAHNGDSARWLAQTLTERFDYSPLVLVFAAKADKDIHGMLRTLLPIADHLIITQAVDSRAESPENIAEIAREIGYTGTLEIIPQVPCALLTAEAYAGEMGLACVTGSLYLVGEARTVYNLKVGQVARVQEFRA